MSHTTSRTHKQSECILPCVKGRPNDQILQQGYLLDIRYNSAVRHGAQEAHMEEKHFSAHVLIMFYLHTDHSSS